MKKRLAIALGMPYLVFIGNHAELSDIMKKTITLTAILFAGCSLATAADISLVCGVDFNNVPTQSKNGADLTAIPVDGGGTRSLNIGTSTTATVTGITTATGEAVNFAQSSTKVGSTGMGSYNSATQVKVQLGNLGVSTDTGFTIAINGQTTDSNWRDLFCFQIMGADGITVTSYEAQFPGTSLNVYKGTSGGTNMGTLSSLATNTWYSFFVTAKGSDYTLTAMSLTGNVVSTVSFTGAEGTLTSVVQGFLNSARESANKRVDNIGVYDGVLTTGMMREVTLYEVENGTMMKSIPEPATATLSLLALAGLCARRRRK